MSMAYIPHPYATATPSPSSSTKSRPKRPTITTAAPTTPTGCTSPTSFLSSSSATSPSPITFARASVISPLPDRETLREKKDRRRGLIKSERSTAALDALLRAPEASPRAAPKTLTPQLTRMPTSASIKPTIQRLPIFSRPENGHESDKSNGSTPTNRASSPTPSYGSGSGSAPSTPGQPRTPVSIELPYSAIIVAPLAICKANRTPSPIPPTKFKLQPDARTPSPTTSQSKENSVQVKRQSRGRFHARNSSIPLAERIFAPLEVNTTTARALDLSLESPRGASTLTGVLAEFEREVIAVPPVPAVPEVKEDSKEEDEDDDDESDWLDISDDRDPLEDAEFYRADIASHLQLFSSNSFPPSSGRRPSYAWHTRSGSSSSSISRWQHQLPPARPDSIPPPPHFLSSLAEPESVASLPRLPFLPELSQQNVFPRRASASSLASTASGRSTRSNGSASSKSKRRSTSRNRSNRRTSRHSVVRRSTMASVAGRRSMNGNVNRALPPTPDEKNTKRTSGPSALLDPTYSFTDPSKVLWEDEEGMLDSTALSQIQTQTQTQTHTQRPPPRFSMPVSINDEDVFGDDLFPPVSVPLPGAGMGTGMRFRMGSVVEEDEDEEEDGLIDPFVLDSFPMVDPSGSVTSRSDGGSTTRIEVNRNRTREGIDPFTIPEMHAISPLTSTASPLSPPFSQSRPWAQQPTQTQARHQSRPQPRLQPLLLVPSSPSASSNSNSNDTFDAETLYSSYASFSPSFSTSLSPDNNTNTAASRKDSTGSVYLDSQGRPLQSRWSVSTFASTAPPTSSSTRSFFPKLANVATTVPSRLSARLKAARERAIQQAKEREEREDREDRERKEGKEVVVRPYPFFPTPTPPSPKRKAPPGRYVPKPELMPQKRTSEESGGSESSRDSSETVHSSTLTPTSSASANMNMNTSTTSPKGKSKDVENQSQSQSRSRSPTYVSQFAQYRSYRRDQQQQQQGSPAGQSRHSSSPPRWLINSSLGSGSKLRTSSTDSLSAFPFVLGGERLSSESRRSTEVEEDAGSGLGPRLGSDEGHGMRRKAIPAEIFSRA